MASANILQIIKKKYETNCSDNAGWCGCEVEVEVNEDEAMRQSSSLVYSDLMQDTYTQLQRDLITAATGV